MLKLGHVEGIADYSIKGPLIDLSNRSRRELSKRASYFLDTCVTPFTSIPLLVQICRPALPSHEGGGPYIGLVVEPAQYPH